MGAKLSRQKSQRKLVKLPENLFARDTGDQDTNINIKIPKGFNMIKIVSYNVDLRNSIIIDSKIKNIISYITSKNKGKDNDIICLQGFHDHHSAFTFIREFKNYCVKNKLTAYVAPTFDEMNSESVLSSKQMINISWNSSDNKTSSSKKKKLYVGIQNIIISKYPIIGIMYSELDNKTDMDDLLGIKSVIAANILIKNKIISVYNTALSRDIRSANIINNEVRKTELDELFEVVKKNKLALTLDKFADYEKSDAHFIVGSLNMSEIDGNNPNPEFIDFIKKNHCFDIFRHLKDNDIGYTTSYMERYDYILFLLSDDLYDVNSQFYIQVQNIDDHKKLFNMIFKRHSVYFIDCFVKNNINSDSIHNYPVECIFMMK